MIVDLNNQTNIKDSLDVEEQIVRANSTGVYTSPQRKQIAFHRPVAIPYVCKASVWASIGSTVFSGSR